MSVEPQEPTLRPCPACNGNGSVVMSLCCGRGCATCPGDGMMRAIDCDRCGGTGRQADASAPAATP
jgi:DnaJ-class molecular chaperone